jgi:tRNA threonylcarbamoyladenosine biosynthesis protein TsaB
MPKVNIVVIALASPILIGVYAGDKLILTHESEDQSSEYLPVIFEKLLNEYEIEKIIYANGPGSFMAIKMSYLFLKSLEIVKGIELFSALAFEFNDFSPIKALGKLYFHYENGEILTAPLGDATLKSMSLPKELDYKNYSTDTEPNYVLPAVN